jgi:phospholipase C
VLRIAAAPALNAIDGKTTSYWHSRWSAPADPLPHSYSINFGGGVNEVAGLVYTPRQNSGPNGNIGEYEVRTPMPHTSCAGHAATSISICCVSKVLAITSVY